MSQSVSRAGRTHNAESARAAILDAAAQVFAEHGFDGARVDSIAETAGYNKSLIFQYFGDKLGLYTEVIRRADAGTRSMQTQVLTWLAEDEGALSPVKFAPLMQRYLSETFDFYSQNPQLRRIFLWEMAENWQTYAKIAEKIDTSELELLAPLVESIRSAGLLRSDFDPMIQIVLAQLIVIVFLASVPLFQIFMPGEGLPSPEAMARARAFVIEFITRGLLADRPQAPQME